MHPSKTSAYNVAKSRCMSKRPCKMKLRGRGRPKGSSGKSAPPHGYNDTQCHDARVWRNLSVNLSRFEG